MMKGPKLKVAVGHAPFRRARLIAYLIGRGLIQKLLTWLLWGAPLSEGRALVAYLIARGLIQKLTKPGGGTQTVHEK